MTRFIARPALLLLLLLLGCGDASSTEDTSVPSDTGMDSAVDAPVDAPMDTMAPPGPIAEADLATRFAAAFCDASRPCCETDAALRDDCEVAVQAEVERILARPRTRMVYDADAAGECVSALEASPSDCDAAIAGEVHRAVCSPVMQGTVAPGDACDSPEECERQPGAIGDTLTGFVGCAMYGGSTERRCRQFVSTTMEGAECEMGFTGDAPTVNVCSADTLFCRDGLCAVRPGLGEPCSDGFCDDGDAYCNAGDSMCTRRATEGEDCTVALCAQGLTCESDVCEPRPQRLPGVCFGFACVAADATCTMP